MEAAQELEIASIVESQLHSEEKNMLLDFYLRDCTLPAQEINKCNTSMGVDLQDKIQHKEEDNTKEGDNVISKLKDKSLSHSPSQQEAKATRSLDPSILEVVSSIGKSDLTFEEKSSVLAAFLLDEDISLSKDNTATTSQEVKLPGNSAKAKESLDPFIIELVLSIQNSNLTSEEKSSVLAAVLLDEDISLSKDNTATTSQEVKLLVNSGKSQDSEEKAKDGNDYLLHDETSEKIYESLSFRSPHQEGKANVSSGSELNLNEKSTYNGTEKDIPPLEDDTSSTSSSKIELEEVDQLTDTKASTQITPAESCRIMLEHEVLTVKESHGNSSDELTIHTQEAACKHCHKLMFQESHVLKAKCGCTSSLIHVECSKVWSQEKGNKCSYCEKEIQNTSVTLSLIPRQASGENPKTPSSRSRGSWCCF